MQEVGIRLTNQWVGNQGEGTRSFSSYKRDFVLGKGQGVKIVGSDDPNFDGSEPNWNPEEILLGSLSASFKLAYLHCCARNGVSVIGYHDDAKAVMYYNDEGGHFQEAVLHPFIVIDADSDEKRAMEMIEKAKERCFVYKSLNFEIFVKPQIEIAKPMAKQA